MAESEEKIFSLFIDGHLTSLLSSLKCNPLEDHKVVGLEELCVTFVMLLVRG